MPPEERRAALVEATLPLLLTHGTALTTKQVAEAAGVAEGTIFRVFPSLAELIDATTREALSAERLQRDIAAVKVGESLHSVTAAALGLLMRRTRSIGQLLHSLHHSPESSGTVTCLRDELEARVAELDGWLIQQLTPHLGELTTEPRHFVEYLRTIALGHTLAHNPTLTIDHLAQLALTGAGKAC